MSHKAGKEVVFVLLPRYRVLLMIQQGGRMFMFQARPSVRLVEIDFSFSYVERRTDACVHARPPTRGPLTCTEKVCETVVGRAVAAARAV